MESIMNIEDRLRTIKAIFKICIGANVFPDEIYIFTIYQKWEVVSNFRTESLSLSFEDPRHKKSLDIIYELTSEILALYDQLKYMIGEIGAAYHYKVECMASGSGLHELNLVRWNWDSERHEEFQFINGEWWPYRGINNEDNSDFVYTTPLFLINFVSQLHQFLKERIFINAKSSTTGTNKLMSISTNADKEQILNFWLKLTGNNEKGEPYWESEKEIEHFVNQNFDVFDGIDEIKEFNPNMNKSELNQVVWTFYHLYGVSKSKELYEKLLMQNFTKFKDGEYVYGNIKDYSKEHLKRLFK
jgi:hypothetical protein